MRWPAVLVTLPMVSALEQEVAHLPLHHAGIAAVPSFQVDFAAHFAKKKQVMIFRMGEGEKIPISISGIG
jgi:hypothetical protein